MGHGSALTQEKLQENMHLKTIERFGSTVCSRPTVRLVTIKMTCRNGSFNEIDEFNGLSQLYRYLFFRANKDYPDFERLNSRMNYLATQLKLES